MPPFGKAVDMVADAITRPGGLTYGGIKQLRSSVGELLNGGAILPEGLSKAELNIIYGALTTDLEKSAVNGGGKAAEQAFQRANSFYAAAQARNRALAKIVGPDGAANGEKVFDRITAMAMSGGRADAKALWQAKRSMPLSDWNELTSGIISKMGRATPDAPFSTDRFVTAWEKMSAEGKNAMFGSSGPLRQALDDIATLSIKGKTVDKFANTSNTGRTMITAGFSVGLISEPITTISTAIGADLLARALAKPTTAQGVANWAKTYQIAVQKPTAASAKAMRFASQRLGSSIAREFGMPAAANDLGSSLYQAIAGTGRAAADNDQNRP
jgi:hypothetical protein